jgi:Rrf2 family transcriptional regulator, nitric oxide-sensitive transcriptional repressor
MAMISKTAEYALRAVVFLAKNQGRSCSGKEISEGTHVPRGYLTFVMRTLSAAGVVVVTRGPGGGYATGRRPDKISVFDVVGAFDATSRIVHCPLGNDEHLKLCPLHRRLDDWAVRAEQGMRETMITELISATANSHRCSFPENSAR